MDAESERERADVIARFGALLRSHDRLALDELALYVAACHRPSLDTLGVLAQLDAIAGDVPSPTVEGVARHLFDTLAFRGNTQDYDDPANSYLDEVLARRTGLPITLSVLTIEVARRVGVALTPVGLPGHFIVGVDGDADRFVDPFGGGRLLDGDGVRALLRERTGTRAHVDDSWLAPVSPLAVVVRMLANLKHVFAQRGRIGDLRWVMQMRAVVPGLGPEEASEFARLMAPTN